MIWVYFVHLWATLGCSQRSLLACCFCFTYSAPFTVADNARRRGDSLKSEGIHKTVAGTPNGSRIPGRKQVGRPCYQAEVSAGTGREDRTASQSHRLHRVQRCTCSVWGLSWHTWLTAPHSGGLAVLGPTVLPARPHLVLNLPLTPRLHLHQAPEVDHPLHMAGRSHRPGQGCGACCWRTVVGVSRLGGACCFGLLGLPGKVPRARIHPLRATVLH